MRKEIITLILLVIISGPFCYSQEKETISKNGVDSQVTISDTGMYDGTKSLRAKKFFDQAGEYGDKGDFENAQKFYLKAIKEDAKYVEAYDNLGLVYRRLGNFDKAIEYYNKSIELYPNGQMAHQNLAVVYVLQEDYKNAIKEYEEILRISPNDPEGYFGIANTYMMLSKFDDALVNAEKALKLYKQTNSSHIGDGYYLIGLINYYKGEENNAKEYLQLAKDNGVKLNPQLEQELFGKGSENKKQYQLNTKEDYAKYEQDVITAYNWLMDTPLNVEADERAAKSAFLLVWMTGSPNVTIEISDKIVTYMDCADCLMIFMGGWTKYALESKDFENKVKGNLAGTENVIKFYQKNKESIGRNKAIEKFIKLKEENKLEDFIKSNI